MYNKSVVPEKSQWHLDSNLLEAFYCIVFNVSWVQHC